MPIEIMPKGDYSRDDHHRPDKECGEKHKQRVAKATLELAIDISTDFNCREE